MKITTKSSRHRVASKSSGRLTACAIAGLAAMGFTTPSHADTATTYTGIVLYPLLVPSAVATPGSTPISVGNYPQTTAEGQTVGSANNRALLWSGRSIAPVQLNPAGSFASAALGTDGAKQVGWAEPFLPPVAYGISVNLTHAEVWSGTAASGTDINPLGFTGSSAYGINGSQEVGSGWNGSTGEDSPVALMWPGISAATASSAVNLNPTGFSSSTAYGTDTVHQVGFGIPNTVGASPVSAGHALLWSGTASSAVDLNPAGFAASYAYGVSGSQEVGYGNHNGEYNALLWTGTAASAVDLNPIPTTTGAPTFTQSYASGTNGTHQVGWASNGTVTDAVLWTGTASSAVNLNSLLPPVGKWSDSQAYTIDAAGHIYGTATGTLNGITAAYAVEWVTGLVPVPLSFTGATANATWDISSTAAFTAGSSATTYQDGDSVNFGDTSSPTNTITLVPGPAAASNPGYLTPSATTVDTTQTYTFNGAGIAGTGALVKTGTGTLSLNNSNSYSGPTNISQGTVVLGTGGAIPNTPVTVGDGTNAATLKISAGSTTTVQILTSLNITPTGTVSLDASTGTNRTLLIIGSGGLTNNGVLDLANNDLDIQGGSLPAITAMIAQGYNGGIWTGTGITSSTAAADPNHLTAIGVTLNTVDGTNPLFGSGTPLGGFDGTSPGVTDVLARTTYYGDANLDGQVDGSDYSRIDAGYAGHLTGWSNGDFNYDGAVDGSDYTLIDNAFNTQGANLVTADVIATTTDQVGGASVPEPTSILLPGIGAMGILQRRRRISRPS